MQRFSAKQRTFLKAIRATYSIAPAADRVRIHRATVHRWMKDPDFANAVQEAREAGIEDVEAVHFEKAKDRDTLSRIHFLKSHRREVYGDNQASSPPPLTQNVQLNIGKLPTADISDNVARMAALLLQAGADRTEAETPNAVKVQLALVVNGTATGI